MTNSLRKSIFLLAAATLQGAAAQTYQATPDAVPGGMCYYEVNGAPAGASGSETLTGWPSAAGTAVAYYIHMPAGAAKGALQATVGNGKTASMRLSIKSMTTGASVADGLTFSLAGKGESTATEAFAGLRFPETGWYRFELTCTSGSSAIADVESWQIYKESTTTAFSANYLSSPSVHLNSWGTTDPDAPSGAAYDWCYQEAMIPESSDVAGTYCMTLGILSGYMGIQVNGPDRHDVIFSMWDNGSTDEDPDLPDYLRSGSLDAGEGVLIERFGNEGTGTKAFRTGNYWRPGQWVKFLTNARPEEVNVTVTDADGSQRVITYHNTLVTAWYKAEGVDEDWQYIATHRLSGANRYFEGWYSFLENYSWTSGQVERKAYYRHGYMRSMASGRWSNRNTVGFSHTDGGSATGARNDYGQGRSDEYDNCFFMSTGGYTPTVQTDKSVPLKTDFTPATDEELARLLERVDQAVRTEQANNFDKEIQASCPQHDTKDWSVTAYSDQADSGEGSNGRAAQTIDGDQDTYWHSRWADGEAGYPHWLSIKAAERVSIASIGLTQKRGSNYRPKYLNVYTSDNGTQWTRVATQLEVADTEEAYVQLPEAISTQYVKLEFTEGQTGGNLLYINEITFHGTPDLTTIRTKAEALLAGANRFGGYAMTDLAEVAAIYDEGRVTDAEALAGAMQEVMRTAQPLKYGVVGDLSALSSFKAYQLHNVNGYGTAIRRPGNANVWLGETTASGGDIADDDFRTAVDVTQPDNNWLIIRSEARGTYYLVNMGSYEFVTTGHPSVLTPEATPISISRVDGGFVFNSSADSRDYLCASPQFAAEPVCNWTSTDAGSVWEIRDNYALTPDIEEVRRIIEAIETSGTLTGLEPARPALPAEAQRTYDLSGRLVARPAAGVYIVNGRKRLVR